ncbi:hypothetical protein D9M71_733120 [compost metagenome]
MDHPLPTGQACESSPDRPQTAAEDIQPAPMSLNQDFDYLDDLMDMLQEPGELENE